MDKCRASTSRQERREAGDGCMLAGEVVRHMVSSLDNPVLLFQNQVVVI